MGVSEAGRATTRAARSAGRAGASANRRVGRLVHRLSGASGARETGLSSLIELTAAGSAGDAFVAVALAGTVFFNTSLHEARSQVVLYLVLTMAPFALLAPFIGPMLDRVRQGRRYILMGTLLARGLLCWAMSGAVSGDPITLFPAAFGVLVLQKAYSITRSSVTPRLLPPSISLVTANARNGLAATIASTIAAPVAFGIEHYIGAPWVLRIGTLVYLGATVLGARVPDHVDETVTVAAAPATATAAAPGEPPTAAETPYLTPPIEEATADLGANTAPERPPPAPGKSRRGLRSLGPVVGEAVWTNAAVRVFAGFMVFFLAFLLRSSHFHGFSQNEALGALVFAAAAGGLIGTGAGALFRSRVPQSMAFGVLVISIAACAFSAVVFNLGTALIVAFVASVGTVLAKLALDSTIQREIPEDVRTSTFAVSETVHQVSWVAGGLAGVLISITGSGPAGLGIATAVLAAALVLLITFRRRRRRVHSTRSHAVPQAS
ncbi:MAG TPA: MFS transporter [Streptosporangiaceae bacterium]|nr:MFS transporter [Streptosporangiaceae bacterium]